MTPTETSCERRCFFLIPLAALVAVAPLVLGGCSCGHDFDFHLLNWMEAARQFSHGNLHPHWVFSAAYNAGEPRFVFYPPASWYLGALLGLLLTHLPGVTQAAGWSAAPILFTWIALTASGFTMLRLARAFAGANAALLAAILYLANPYMLFTAYERSAYAELLAAAWIPLLLHAILRDEITIPRIALPVALLWLTNVPAAIIGSYTLALLAAIRISMRKKGAAGTLLPALKTSAGFALGLALAAFYIIPVAHERRFVQIAMATIGDMRIDHNFLIVHGATSPQDLLHEQVLHTASAIAAMLLAVSAVGLIMALLQRRRRVAPEFPTLALGILTVGIAFLFTPWSAPIWNHAPDAAFLQFPWRLLLAVAPIFALTLPYSLIERMSVPSFLPLHAAECWKLSVQTLTVLVLAAIFTLPAYQLFRQPCDPEDTAPARLALFQSNAGTDPTDEYTPTAADNAALKPNNPPYWLAASPTAAAPVATHPGITPTQLTLAAPRAEYLILNLRDYPAWRIAVNGLPTPHLARRPDGLIAIPIPAGRSTVDIRYAHARDQTFGDATTLLAFALFVFVSRRKPRIPGTS